MCTPVRCGGSKKQTKANQENAQKSPVRRGGTGPKTDEGKKISSQNAVKHGLFSTSPVINSPRFKENQEEYELLKEALTLELNPSGILQTHQVQKIVDCMWRYRRAINAEKTSVDKSEKDRSNDAFVEFFNRGGLTRLQYDPKMNVKEEVKKLESESPPIPSGETGLELCRYEMRLDRQLHRAFRLLRLLQRLQSPKTPKKRKRHKK